MVSEEELEKLKAEMKRAQKRWNRKKTDRNQREMRRAQSNYDRARADRRFEDNDEYDFYITDHAAMRFIQRRMNLDINEVKAMMLSELDMTTVEILKTGKFPLSSGGRIVVRDNGTVVTFLD